MFEHTRPITQTGLGLASVVGLAAGLMALPAPAQACGGMFCDAAQPVTQAAERILFAQDPEDPDRIHMHVQIQYQGPPVDFGWLLPVPPDVETEAGFEELYTWLDANYAPFFSTRLVDHCIPPAPDAGLGAGGAGGGAGGMGGGGGEGGGGGGGVQVLSREAVGPYDQAVLAADDVEPLRMWLDENGYNIPEGVDEVLLPYIEQGSVFVALKLLAGRDTNDISPLHLTFTSPMPGIPLRPTAVAAEPDMGIIVHLLGNGRGVPLNYSHVEINEALVDWSNFGSNYADVVAHAVDEAEGGHGFVTDYSGPSDALLNQARGVRDDFADEQIPTDLDRLRTIEDLHRMIDEGRLRPQRSPTLTKLIISASALTREEMGEIGIEATLEEALFCRWCLSDRDRQRVQGYAFDGPLVAEGWRTWLRPESAHLYEIVASNTRLTRLYTTLNAEEMDRDPLFGFNPDLPVVDSLRVGARHLFCDEFGQPDFQSLVVETPSGLRYREEVGTSPVQVLRARGMTARNGNEIGAAVISRATESGEMMILVDNREALAARHNDGPRVEQPDDNGAGGGGEPWMMNPMGGAGGGAGGMGGESGMGGMGGGMGDGDDESGCSCEVTDSGPVTGWWLLALGLVWRARRDRTPVT